MFTRNFGRLVRDKRERKHLTVAHAAELAGLSETGLTMIELGDTNPKLSSITSLATVLDIDLGDLNPCKPSLEELAEKELTTAI
jgi:transcriptional regulator with XRE-family HTH domain